MELVTFRLLPFLVALVLIAASCSGSSQSLAGTEDESLAGARSSQSSVESKADEAVEVAETPAGTEADDTVETAETEADTSATLLLPDPQRWVVVEDWSDRSEVTGSAGDFDDLQLDVAPLDSDGVPELGRRISLGYRVGPVEDSDRHWGDGSSMGDPVEFVVEGGIGRSVHNRQMGFAMAVVWVNGTWVSIQTQDPEADLTELAMSIEEVETTAWTAARAGAGDQRLIAIEAAMQNVEPIAPLDEPLPHWVLPEPWQLQWVTDMTIWTPEQQAQAVAFAEANRPPAPNASTPGAYRSWHYGFASTAQAASVQFVPQVTITVLAFEEAPNDSYPINYETISALGLDGVISPLGGSFGFIVELGTDEVRVNVRTSQLDKDSVRSFLDAIEFATGDPLEGFVVSDPRFQPITLTDPDIRPPNWHALWKNPDGGPDAVTSVWRLSVPELRTWLQNRGDGFDMANDVWETVAANGNIDFGNNATYDVSTGLLMTLRGIEQSDLIPIELDDWITLVEPVNTDPINPR